MGKAKNREPVIRQQAERELQRERANREELVERLAQVIGEDGTTEPLAGLRLRRESAPTGIGHGVSYPSFCVIAQGSKEVLLGDARYRYNPAQYILSTAALPIASRVAEASPERPYLGMVLKLDPALVGSVLVEVGQCAPQRQATLNAIDVSPLDAGLLDAVVRLIQLVTAPAERRFLVPLVTREIVYRLALGAQGGRLHHIAALGGATHRIIDAVERLRNAFNQPLRIEELARDLGMSVSSFHQHFRALTAMSPLQFQKQLRLQEARRLMLGEGFDAASASYRVGYANPSHFTREYKRLFGEPPIRDVEHLRAGARERVGL